LGVLIAFNLQGLVHGWKASWDSNFLDAHVYFMSDLPAHVRLSDVVKICAFAFVLACLSTLYPPGARRACCPPNPCAMN